MYNCTRTACKGSKRPFPLSTSPSVHRPLCTTLPSPPPSVHLPLSTALCAPPSVQQAPASSDGAQHVGQAQGGPRLDGCRPSRAWKPDIVDFLPEFNLSSDSHWHTVAAQLRRLALCRWIWFVWLLGCALCACVCACVLVCVCVCVCVCVLGHARLTGCVQRCRGDGCRSLLQPF